MLPIHIDSTSPSPSRVFNGSDLCSHIGHWVCSRFHQVIRLHNSVMLHSRIDFLSTRSHGKLIVNVNNSHLSIFSIEDLRNLFEGRLTRFNIQKENKRNFECNPALVNTVNSPSVYATLCDVTYYIHCVQLPIRLQMLEPQWIEVLTDHERNLDPENS
jgi:hypothetical protein